MNTTEKVKQYLTTCEIAQTTAPIVAKGIAMSDTTMRRRLREESTNFCALLKAEQRRRVHTALTERPSINAKRLAGECGYGKVDHFYRAFRGWFGQGYTQYRRNLTA
jgi:AraC-like DNA-binding protein